MACDEPLTAYYSRTVGASGKRGITFSRTAAFSPTPLKLPCGQCMQCRLAHARMWAVRCMHERQMHEESVFATLTYDDKNLPENGTLVREHPQLWLKRLRKQYGSGIKFYGCGEYGEDTNRPHYHVLLFGMDFRDKRFYKKSKNGDNYYTSVSASKLWTYGNTILADVTFKSCAYVAGYVTKKVTGDKKDDHYMGRLPEFPMMSRNPGIASEWFDKYGAHAYNWDSVVMNGREMRPPRYYDTKFELLDADTLMELKLKRRREAMKHRADNTSARRHVKEEVLRRSLKKREF